jgi:hypothetical protein
MNSSFKKIKKTKKDKKKRDRKKKDKKKRRRRDTSSDSDSSTTSSSSSSSSDDSRVKHKSRKRKHKKDHKKKKNETDRIDQGSIEQAGEESAEDFGIPIHLMSKDKRGCPETKQDYDKRQSVIRRVVDEETGRTRLVKGDGEIIEEIVSREKHMEINKLATKSDAKSFERKSLDLAKK